MTKKVFIMVATHKEYEFPKDEGYVPLHVGRAMHEKKLNYLGDDTGDNISKLNKNFCELTGLYWLWKNQPSEIFGLSHYRRYFKPVNHMTTVAGRQIATSQDLAEQLVNYDIILSKPRNYWVETISNHYKHAHHASDLKTLELVINEKHPSYKESFSKVMGGRKVSLYNMFVTRADLFQKYNEWLFSILFEVQKLIPYQDYGPYQSRVFGFMAERLLNLWVFHNLPQSRIKYLPVVNLEGEDLMKKAIGLLDRKFNGKKLK